MTDRFAGAYDPVDVRIIYAPPFTLVGGLPTPIPDPDLGTGDIISGYADDTFVTVGRDNVTTTAVAGNDGEHMFQIERKKTGNIGLTLMKSSASNRKLGAALRVTELGTPVFLEVSVFVLRTSTIHTATCMVQGYPEDSRGTAEGNYAWILVNGLLRMNPAGRGIGA